jgi:putative addiction module component (TIGR02574 family)
MSKTIADQLLDIVTAVRELPEEAQQALVHEMADRISAYAASRLTHEQQAEIKRRLADPNPAYVAPEEMQEFFSRFSIRSACQA